MLHILQEESSESCQECLKLLVYSFLCVLFYDSCGSHAHDTSALTNADFHYKRDKVWEILWHHPFEESRKQHCCIWPVTWDWSCSICGGGWAEHSTFALVSVLCKDMGICRGDPVLSVSRDRSFKADFITYKRVNAYGVQPLSRWHIRC